MKINHPPRSITFTTYLIALAMACLVMSGCEREPHQTTRMGICGGFASEHDIKRVGDTWVENKGDDLVFFYTNVSTTPQPRPVFTRADRDSMYYLHVQYKDVTVGCLDPTKFVPAEKDVSHMPMIAPGQTVSGVFTQKEVIDEIKDRVPPIVSQTGSTIAFNYDGYATNPCTFEGVEGNQRLVCKQNTRKDRLADNKARKTFWKRLTNDKNAKEWW
jgi:hypothetical protein